MPSKNVKPVIKETPANMRSNIRALISLMINDKNLVDEQARRLRGADFGQDMQPEAHVLEGIYWCVENGIAPTEPHVVQFLTTTRVLGESINPETFVRDLKKENENETSGIKALSAFVKLWIQERQLEAVGTAIVNIANDPHMSYPDKWEKGFDLYSNVTPSDSFIHEAMAEKEYKRLTFTENQRVIKLREQGLAPGPQFPFEAMNAYFQYLEWGETSLLVAREGRGKAQPLDAKVLTPSGWKLMGDLAYGDSVVNPEGGTSKVIGIFPQGVKSIYRVTMKDGSSTECCEEHLWKTQSVSTRHNSKEWSVKPLKELMAPSPYKDSRPQWYIPMVKSIEFDPVRLPIHPYVMGILLGDGCFTNATPSVSSRDWEIIENLKNLTPSNVYVDHIGRYDYRLTTRESKMYGNPVTNALHVLDLNGKNSFQKFIPEIYKRGSIEERIQLLQGIFDSDGYCHEGRAVDYVTVSIQLAMDVIEVSQSLGGTGKLSRKQTSFTYKGEKKSGAPAFRVRVKLPHPINPFLLPRKAESYRSEGWYQPYRSIKSIEYVADKEAQCIQLDSENQLYVTDDYIVTHNTTVLQTLEENIAWRQKLKCDVVHFSLETPLEVLSRRTFSRYSFVPYNDIKNGVVDLASDKWKPLWDKWENERDNATDEYGYIRHFYQPDSTVYDISAAMVRSTEVSLALGRRIFFGVDHMNKVNWQSTHAAMGEYAAQRAIALMLDGTARKLSVRNPNHLMMVAQEGDVQGQVFGGKFAAKIAQYVFSLQRETFGTGEEGGKLRAPENLMISYDKNELTAEQKKHPLLKPHPTDENKLVMVDRLGNVRYYYRRGDEFSHRATLALTKGNDNALGKVDLIYEGAMSRVTQDPKQVEQMRKDGLLLPLGN